MVYNTTYKNEGVKELINDVLGKPFSFFQALKLGGIGSKRMIIEETSNNLNNLLNKVSDMNYGNIELRPNGILVMINKGLENYTWVIPYRQLVIYKTYGLSIHAEGKFIRFKNNKTFKENTSFFKKLIRLKVKNQERFSIPAYE
ncbi:hypothetical protein [Pseudotenacibaculum haliotis]|uniref:Arginyl-tRNA synthetase n=1 Tax=Pseudotenacibaculum haliotis TaxID=1862138 RepID=A0ABW5LTS4_9FLAO